MIKDEVPPLPRMVILTLDIMNEHMSICTQSALYAPE